MEQIREAILSGNQRTMTVCGVLIDVPTFPRTFTQKQKESFAKEEAEKLYKIICD